MHIRRGDFGRNCKDSDKCYTPLAKFKKGVDGMLKQLLEKKNIDIKKVILMSGTFRFPSSKHLLFLTKFTKDEKDPKFWEEVREMGWVHFDHEKEATLERYGEWYLPLIDIISQSLASGFVGTMSSTFSLVSARRVEDWNGGPTVLVSR